MSKEFLKKLRMVASEADDLLTSCDASDLLDGLEVARDFMFEAASMIDELESRLAQVERENKAMLHDMARYTMCGSCKHFSDREKCPQHDECVYGKIGHFEWRGVCAENTEEGTET